ncbi:2Fe-2S iron-sulfur cluster binding domain-containing protein [Alteromonadaceae bacterium M269]|nr:2Fe-2S iron-sulfur cluster binding domain-containing protein [Alteromonadaceae bacterium M269]
MPSVNTNKIDKIWSSKENQVAWGTVALFLAIVLGFIGLISGLAKQSISAFQAIPISTLLIYLSFTVLHEAGHKNISQGIHWMKPFERLMGWMCAVPFLIIPFSLFARIHDYHHAFTNDPDRDPDHWVSSDSWIIASVKALFLPLYYIWHISRDFSHDIVIRKTLISSAVYWFLMTALVGILMAFNLGPALLIAWVIPIVIASYILAMLFDWIPHTPNLQQNRYQNTRIYTAPVLDILTLGQSYHLIHHLNPRIPWYAYKRVFFEVEQELEQQNSPIEGVLTQGLPSLFKAPSILSPSIDAVTGKYTFTVDQIIQESSDTVRVKFDPDQTSGFQFKAGQYITVGKRIGYDYITRCYSICSSENSRELSIAVKRVESGVMSYYLNNELNVGDKLTVAGPFGHFVLPHPNSVMSRQILLVAGGSGISPTMSLLKTILEDESNESQITLLYSFRDAAQAAFVKEIQGLVGQHERRLTTTFFVSHGTLTKDSHAGRLTPSALREVWKKQRLTQDTQCFICGPKAMMGMVKETLESLGVPTDRVTTEEYQLQNKLPQGEKFRVTVKMLSGVEHQLTVAENQTVLEVASQQGVKLPNACGMGQCGCCSLNLKSGKEEYVNEDSVAILPSERALGKTLACQCRPKSDLILEESH